MAAELKPCPFCGYEYPTIVYQNSTAHWEIRCPNCDIVYRLGAGSKDRIKGKIIEAWNRRTTNES